MNIINFSNIIQLQEQIAASGLVDYVFIKIKPNDITPDPICMDRMLATARDLEASLVFSGYRYLNPDGSFTNIPGLEYQPGSIRDDFDFGPLVCVNAADAIGCISEILQWNNDMPDGGWYALRLALSRLRMFGMIPEILYTVQKIDLRHSGQQQHDYVNPRRRSYQEAMEEVFLHYLNSIGALSPRKKNTISLFDYPHASFLHEMSVIIPVRNRKNTIEDAVQSALSQNFSKPFNVIVVDNYSDDGTREILDNITDPRLIVIKTEQHEHLGIGGCWNKAINHPSCGRFAVQLDSDDVYSSPDTLSTIWEKFKETSAAAVVGSYIITDFNKEPIPPGLISHDEWTDQFGADNALRINGFGAPRAYFTPLLRENPFPNVSYGEDYAVMLRLSRQYKIARIFDPLYLCRRWNGNSDALLSPEKINEHNFYKDYLRSCEVLARMADNRRNFLAGKHSIFK